MSAASSGGTPGAGRFADRAAAWLSLAAAPTFGLMAVLTAGLGAGPMEMLCSSGRASPLNGMAAMYALMSAFHASPWLKLIAGRGGR